MVGSSVSDILSQSLYKYESDHYRLSSENNKYRATAYKNAIIYVTAILVIIVLLTIVLFLYLKTRNRYKLQLIETNFTETQHMLELAHREELANQAKLLEIRKNYALLYHKEFAEIGRLYHTDSVSEVIEKGYLKYATRVGDILDEISSDKRKHTLFVARLNKDLDGIVDHLKEDFPNYDEDTIRFLCYVIAGFEPATIAMILGDNAGTVRSRKSRLKKQILESDTPNHALYEAFIT